MPELPEVETVVQILKRLIIGKKIEKVNVLMDKLIKNCEPIEFINMLTGETIENVERRGKNILIITNNYCVINHLRMEGKFFFMERETNYDSHHTLVKFFFSNGGELHYHDTRRFGTFHIYSKIEYTENRLLNNIGLEPFDKKLTSDYLFNIWSTKRKEIKKLLLEQNVICGIGNIYACEILFDCNISPFKKGKDLTKEEIKKIIISTKKILKNAIRAGGSTVSSFSVGHGISGKFQNELKVYSRKEEECYVCKNKIEKEVLGGRGTYFCSRCQT